MPGARCAPGTGREIHRTRNSRGTGHWASGTERTEHGTPRARSVPGTGHRAPDTELTGHPALGIRHGAHRARNAPGTGHRARNAPGTEPTGHWAPGTERTGRPRRGEPSQVPHQGMLSSTCLPFAQWEHSSSAHLPQKSCATCRFPYFKDTLPNVSVAFTFSVSLHFVTKHGLYSWHGTPDKLTLHVLLCCRIP